MPYQQQQQREPDYVSAYFKLLFFRAEFRIVGKIGAGVIVAVGVVISAIFPDATAGYFACVFAIGGLAFVAGCLMVAWALIKFLFTPNRMAMIPPEYTQLYRDPLGTRQYAAKQARRSNSPPQPFELDACMGPPPVRPAQGRREPRFR